MRLRFVLTLAFVVLGGCEIAIPNGLFGCGQPSDCPSGYFCWSSDSRCYDAKEPDCVPKTCEQVISEFASLGIVIECGSLPDGCEGSIECGSCPAGSVCGANGDNFSCGCEENTCGSYGGGAECGVIPTRCGGQEEAIFCGNCLGEFVCSDNKCVCPVGADCDAGCAKRCVMGEVCVNGECCRPTYPCTTNECSPPGGLPDGCGGVAQCPACANGEDCLLSDNLVYECVGDCTCEAQNVECGNATICGTPKLCGTCAANGFGPGYRCEAGQCVCEDQHEPNDSFDDFALVCGDGMTPSCAQEAWSVDLQATLHSNKDADYYALRVLDARTAIFAQAYGGSSDRMLYMTYLCPDGHDGLDRCSGSKETIQGIEFCVVEGDIIGIERKCDGNYSASVGTVLVGVESSVFRSDCDPYGLKVFATFQAEPPVAL
ncbi:MAG: hypothetical protein OEV36_03915 [Myxococcales bacterium]|nr:hypothetical protein [Myxococcales bacterium]